METPEAAPRAPAPGTVPLPIGDVLRIANEYERGGRLGEAKRLLDCILQAAFEIMPVEQPRERIVRRLVGHLAGQPAQLRHVVEQNHGADELGCLVTDRRR